MCVANMFELHFSIYSVCMYMHCVYIHKWGEGLPRHLCCCGHVCFCFSLSILLSCIDVALCNWRCNLVNYLVLPHLSNSISLNQLELLMNQIYFENRAAENTMW